jgi:hypothetical protein
MHPSIRPISQTHSAQTLTPNLLNMLNSLNQMRNELRRVFSGREVSQVGHNLVHSASNLVCSLLRHLGSIRPVVLAREHVDWATLCVDGCHARPAIPAAKVKIEIPMKNTEMMLDTEFGVSTLFELSPVCLSAVQVPDELLVG